MLVLSLTVVENMVLGMEPKNNIMIDHTKAIQMTESLSNLNSNGLSSLLIN